MKDLHARHSATYTVAELCGLFGMSKQAYYKHDRDADLRRMAREEFALQYIRQIREKDPGIGGVKLWIMYCREFGQADRIGRDRFCEIFDRHGFKLRRRKHKPRTTDSNHNNPLYSNIVKDVIPMRVGEIIVGDITYWPLASQAEDGAGQGSSFAYINLLMDSRSKIIIGRSVALTLEAKYTKSALSQAINVLEGMGVDLSCTIHHSDRGVQYTSAGYIELLRCNRMKISMTRKTTQRPSA